MFLVDYKKVWKDLNASKQSQSYHVIQLAILKAIDKYKDDPAVIPKAKNFIYHKMAQHFTPITRRVKLENGMREFGAVNKALSIIWWPTPQPLLGQKPENILTKEGVRLFNEIRRQLTITSFEEYYNREYVYIFVRQDMTPEYQAVQAAHVTLRMGYELRRSQVQPARMNDLYFTLVGLPNKSALEDVAAQHSAHVAFIEPDLNNQLTAIALYPIKARHRGNLFKYKKLVFAKY